MPRRTKLTKEELAEEIERVERREELHQRVFDELNDQRKFINKQVDEAEVEIMACRREKARLKGTYRDFIG